MSKMTRRRFVKTGAALTALGITGDKKAALYAQADKTAAASTRRAHFISDGLNLTPQEYSRLLSELATANKIEADDYSRAGSVGALEERFAELLGKECAVFMPTGTLANHIALRTLAPGGGRVLVQQESHIYNDSGDCATLLSGLNLIPLAPGRAAFTRAEAADARARANTARVNAPIAAISIETPVRRQQGANFPFDEIKEIALFARAHEIKMHLDGARLFIASAYTGITPAQYSALFDTVYISLYKYFNAAAGAVLAGPRSLLAESYQVRRMFGGGLAEAWPYAAVAAHYLEGFQARFQRAIKIFQQFSKMLSSQEGFQITAIAGGTNIYKLQVQGIDAQRFRENLAGHGITLRPGSKDTNEFSLTVNETLTQFSAEELAHIFIAARRARS